MTEIACKDPRIARKLHAYAVAALVAAVPLIACGSQPTPDEATGEAASALDEVACSTNAITSGNVGASVSLTKNGSCTLASVSTPASYGSPGCENEFVLEVPHVLNNPVAAGYADIKLDASLITDKTACENAHLEIALWGRPLPTRADFPASYTFIGNATNRGTWFDGTNFGRPSQCLLDTLPYPNSNLKLTQTGNLDVLLSKYTDIRVVGSAYTTSVNSKGQTVAKTYPISLTFGACQSGG